MEWHTCWYLSRPKRRSFCCSYHDRPALWQHHGVLSPEVVPRPRQPEMRSKVDRHPHERWEPQLRTSRYRQSPWPSLRLRDLWKNHYHPWYPYRRIWIISFKPLLEEWEQTDQVTSCKLHIAYITYWQTQLDSLPWRTLRDSNQELTENVDVCGWTITRLVTAINWGMTGMRDLQLGRRNMYWTNEVIMCHGSKWRREPNK